MAIRVRVGPRGVESRLQDMWSNDQIQHADLWYDVTMKYVRKKVLAFTI